MLAHVELVAAVVGAELQLEARGADGGGRPRARVLERVSKVIPPVCCKVIQGGVFAG